MPDSPAFIEVLRTVFPVIATVPDHHSELARPDFFGTAFAVGAGVFMTADHVVRAASAHGQVTLGGPIDQAMMGGAAVVDVESWPERDIAVLFCKAGGLTLLNTWLIERVQVLTDLFSFGY